MRAKARSLELVDQRLRLGRLTPADTDRVAALGEAPGDCRADGIARPDKYCYAPVFRHLRSRKFLFSTLLIPGPRAVVNRICQPNPANQRLVTIPHQPVSAPP